MVRLLTLVALVGMAAAAKLPSAFKTCQQVDPKYSECLSSSIEDAIGTLVKGMPSLGIMPIDPLEISELHIGQGEGPVKISMDFNNIKIMGLGTAKITELSPDIENYRLSGKAVMTEPFVIHGPYKVRGQVLVLPINGEGNCNFTLNNLESRITLQGEPFTKGGETYMRVKDFDMKFNTDHLYVNLENLFNGDKALGDAMNTFLNENWQTILDEVKTPFQDALGQSFKEISNRLFLKVPFNEVFPK